MVINKFFKSPGLLAGNLQSKLQIITQISPIISDLKSELCYYIESSSTLTAEDLKKIKFVLNSPFESSDLQTSSYFQSLENDIIIEIGPRLNFSTAFSSNAMSIFKSAELKKILRVEMFTRYLIKCEKPIGNVLEEQIVNVIHDKMTECRYLKPLETFDHGFKPENWYQVNILGEGRSALEKVSVTLGLAFDNWDLDYYTNLFKNILKRNPTSVECFDLAQSNSEHSRHWFFNGKILIDGKIQTKTLFNMIKDTQTNTNSNNVIKFSDNSSAIEGYDVDMLIPCKTYQASNFKLDKIKRHLIFTAETHNFPTGVAPFSGATTGVGGRIRDIQGCGRGGYYIAGTAGYSVGNLYIPNYNLPWEDKNSMHRSNFASPLEIIIKASNGASDYGNKFGEPIIGGFARSFGTSLKGIRTEWIKPIMFSGGVGTVDAQMTKKLVPKKGMEVIKIGGPVYRIGVGGGAASSVIVQGDNKLDLDFGAVQRGDPEMEQKLNRLVRACTEMGLKNPILSIHDQGAGGNGNVLKELVEPAGAVIFTKKFELGDSSISTMELWGAEYQENNAILCKEEDINILQCIANREKCPINFIGKVTDSGKIILSEESDCDASKYLQNKQNDNIRHPVDLELELILGKMPQKIFNMERTTVALEPLNLPVNLTIQGALERVLRLPSVGSKRYLTNKVDRCVTGLIAQQQCVGPLHTPLADVAVTAVSHFSFAGIATSIGEQPIKGLVNVAAGARMTVVEAVSNIVFAGVSNIKDIKCSGNWMWAAKLPGEGAKLYEACQEMCLLMKKFGIAIDGGKDSLSMAARVGEDVVKSPRTLVVSCYAPCPDVRNVVTPDLKSPSRDKKGTLIFVDLSMGKNRIGGTALAQVFNQLGNNVADVEDAESIVKAFNTTQKLIKTNKILAGHDVSDGGLITCLLEMAFGGLSGLNINIDHKTGDFIDILFAEEVGWVLEVEQDDADKVLNEFNKQNVSAFNVGLSQELGMHSEIIISIRNQQVLKSHLFELMKIWEETSYQLEKLQTNIKCVEEEFKTLKNRKTPSYKLTFNPDSINLDIRSKFPSNKIHVAVIREEGTNGDREMAASLLKVGFEVWDVTTQDLLQQHVTLDQFRGVIFPGGFSYADVLGSAKGWATSLLFHSVLRAQFNAFVERTDTFSLGVCNGCQLMSLLGWIGGNIKNPNIVLDHNKSERFECRWSTVKIEKSPAIMLMGMQESILGVWVAHGEGRFTFKNNQVFENLEKNNCLTIKYTDDYGNPTEIYPMNPNGSISGVAGICSTDGRHLAMMPHPERCTEMWQWPYVPPNWTNKSSPWLKMFANAFDWCHSYK